MNATHNPTPVSAAKEAATRNQRFFSHLSASLLGALFAFSLCQFSFFGLSGILIDGLFRTQGWRNPHPDIFLVGYDEKSAGRYEDTSKIPVEEIERITNFLLEESPAAVALLAPVNNSLYADTEIERVGVALQRFSNPYIGYTDDESFGKAPPEGISSKIKYFPGYVSRDTFSYGADSVTRRVMLSIDGLPTVFAKIAQAFRGGAEFHHIEAYGKSRESQQTYIAWQGRPGTYPIIPSEQVANAIIPRGTFTNKIVLIGMALPTNHVLTPYSRQPNRTPVLEGAAHSLVTLLRNDGLMRAPGWFNILFSIFVALLTVNFVLYLSPAKGILLVFFESAFLLVIGWLALFVFHTWVDLAHPLLVAGVGYYLVIPYRLVDEYRQRWHYQEQSELMAQLEQLKNNFFSLITHDLKTPVARIQGCAELVTHEGENLSEVQRKSMQAILQTTDDLSNYVETILDLTRVESARVPLQKTTRDINVTIREVIESKQYLALEKNIELKAALEPIFSFRFDVRLIRRVLSNLVENAIKYSPPNTCVTISSREDGQWVRVGIVDQGFGIAAEDRGRIFAKFYRCQNESTKDTKGTGLGLYLVKYFVELHQGLVELQSEFGQGSTFTVSLPV